MALIDEVVQSLKSLRPLYPARGMTPEQLGQYLNSAVYPFRDEGVGLELKPTGDYAVLPDGKGTHISHDTIRFGNLGGDFLNDAEGTAGVQYAELKAASPDSFVSPVRPSDKPVDLPGDGVIVVPDPVVPVPELDLEALVKPVLDELGKTRQSIDKLTTAVTTLNKSGIKVHF